MTAVSSASARSPQPILMSSAYPAMARLCPTQDAEIGDTFFDALERVGSIHRSCRNLLSSHHHRAGLELMDAMSSYQESAYERLCRCVLLVNPACASLQETLILLSVQNSCIHTLVALHSVITKLLFSIFMCSYTCSQQNGCADSNG